MWKQTALLTYFSLVLGPCWYSALRNTKANCSLVQLQFSHCYSVLRNVAANCALDRLKFGPWYLVLCFHWMILQKSLLSVLARDFLSWHRTQWNTRRTIYSTTQGWGNLHPAQGVCHRQQLGYVAHQDRRVQEKTCPHMLHLKVNGKSFNCWNIGF
jgi:hypothetical protein